MRSASRHAPSILAGLAAAALCGCTWVSGDHRVLVTSEPAGARILVDGEDTGHTTPSMVDLGALLGTDHNITVRKKGFAPEERRVVHYTTAYTARWIDGAADVGLWTFPLFWPLGDWVLPVGVRYVYVPHELYVRLYREGEAPVSGPQPR